MKARFTLGELKKAPKIFKEDCAIDFSRNTNEVYNFIRGLSPFPAAHTSINGKNCKIYRAEIPQEMPQSDNAFDFSALRALRQQQGLTIDALSDRSGVSVAVISKLERNQQAPGLDTVSRLARAFGLSATDLVAMSESSLAHRVDESSHRSGPFKFREIRYANLVGLLGHGPAGATISRPEVHRDDNELCWVLKGRLKLFLPQETCDLRAGSSVQFDAIQEHTYEAIEDTEFVILHLRKDKRY